MAEIERLKAHRAARQLEAEKIKAEAASIASKNLQLNKIHTTLSEEVGTTGDRTRVVHSKPAGHPWRPYGRRTVQSMGQSEPIGARSVIESRQHSQDPRGRGCALSRRLSLPF